MLVYALVGAALSCRFRINKAKDKKTASNQRFDAVLNLIFAKLETTSYFLFDKNTIKSTISAWFMSRVKVAWNLPFTIKVGTLRTCLRYC